VVSLDLEDEDKDWDVSNSSQHEVHSTMTRSSSSPAMRKRSLRTITPMLMLRHLLVGFPWLHPPLPPTTMAHPIECKMIVVTMGPRMKQAPLGHCAEGVIIKGRALKNLREMALRCCTTNSSATENGDGVAESLLP
jgi:hypothetical protein